MGYTFIEPNWLEAVRGKTLFYPAAGSDWTEPLELFSEHIQEFWFADTCYPQCMSMEPVYKNNADYLLLDSAILGDDTATMESREAEFVGKYRHLRPSILREVYQRKDRSGCFIINRRRGFAQYALVNEFTDQAIGAFMHRGDSPGESGSNVYFLAT